MTLKEIAAATGARLDVPDPDVVVAAVTTDSRAVRHGSLFVALPGERTDGHAFVRSALDRGAVAAMVTEPAEGPTLTVDEPLRALALLAEAVRARIDATVVAITGSAGKTSTREFAAAALSSERRTIASTANQNNEIGVPLTIFSADEDTQALVVEVGARGLGHIAALMPIVQPDVAVVTNVGAAHVGMFGSIDNIAAAKGELVEALGTSGVAVLNADDPRVNAMRERTHAPVLTFGVGGTADVRAEDVSFDDEHRARFTIVAGAERAGTALRVPGEHMVANAVAAAAAAIACGVSLDGAASGIAGCDGVPMRVQVVPDGERRIINDAYNASPDSMAVALKTLVGMARGRPTWAVLGPMAELGDHAIEAHDRIGRLAVRLGVGHLVTVGRDALALHEAARLEGMPPDEAVLVESTDEAIDVLRARLEPDAVVLVKASRAAGLERVVEGLLA